jgi:hypothetical protein
LEKLVYFEHVSSGWCHQSVISGNLNVLLMSIWSEWKSLPFGLIHPSSFEIQVVNSNGALWLSVSTLCDQFVRVSFWPHF